MGIATGQGRWGQVSSFLFSICSVRGFAGPDRDGQRPNGKFRFANGGNDRAWVLDLWVVRSSGRASRVSLRRQLLNPHVDERTPRS